MLEIPTWLAFNVRAWETSIGSSTITWEPRKCLIVTRAWPTPRTGTSASWTTWSRCWPGGRAPSPCQCTPPARTSMTPSTPSSTSGTALTRILWGTSQLFMFSLTWVTYPPQFLDTLRFLKRLLFNISMKPKIRGYCILAHGFVCLSIYLCIIPTRCIRMQSVKNLSLHSTDCLQIV